MLTAASAARVLSELGAKADAAAPLPELCAALVARWEQLSQPVIRIPPRGGGAPTGAVIFLHGLGDTGDGWAMELAQSVAPRLPHCAFLFPTARQVPVTLNMGMRMPAWYDISSLDADRLVQDADGIEPSAVFAQALAHLEAAKVGGPGRVAICGFSQGAATTFMAAHTAAGGRLAGAAGLSGYVTGLPLLRRHFAAAAAAATPLFMGHGNADPVVPFAAGQRSRDVLTEMRQAAAAGGAGAAPVEWHEYPGMAHASCPQEMADLTAFLAKCIPPAK